MVVKKVDNVEILLDSNSFASYKIEGDKIAQIPFSSEEVQKVFAEMEDNKGFQESAINLLSQPKDIPTSVDKDALLSIVNATPYSGRIKQIDGGLSVLLTSSDGDNNFFWAAENPNIRTYRPIEAFGRNGDWRIFNTYASVTVPYFQSYFDYLRSEGKSLTEETLLLILKSGTSFNIKKEVVRLEPPIATTSRYTPKIYNDIAYLVNRTNPRESFKLSDTGKLVKANISPANAATILGGALPATQAATPAPAPAPAPAPVSVSSKVTYAADTFFDFNKSVIKPEAKAKLDDLVDKIKAINLEVIIAVGHTDAVGSDVYNQKLSMRRSNAVKAYLISKGVDKTRIYTEGKGEKQPVADNGTKEGRAKNRRVEIEVVGARKN